MKLRSEQIIPLSFLVAIFVGTILLMLPAASADGAGADIVTALFTATTSICVTGLVVVDTYAKWSLFGKIIILILIQLGGLGIISVTSILMLLINRRFSLSHSVILHDAFNLHSIKGLRRFLGGVFSGTILVEMIGALLYMLVFIPRYGTLRGVWYSIFTSISAFCNAGIDILGPNSLIDYSGNSLIMINTMCLIILGGLGYIVWFDVLSGIRTMIRNGYSIPVFIKHLSEHTRLVIRLTILLIAVGAVCVFGMEYSNPDTIGGMSLGGKIINSIFQSVTFRTAGFASVPQQSLRDTTCTMGALLMFIGGSPVGTAGGVKTVTFFVVILNAVAFIRSRSESVVFGRSVSNELIRKATGIIFVSFAVTFIMMILLMLLSDVGLVDAMYETFSATATVGLSRAITPTLNTAGRLIIIICMYLGRIGPISMALFFQFKNSDKNNIRFIKGNYFVG